jgi:hypothetical protein
MFYNGDLWQDTVQMVIERTVTENAAISWLAEELLESKEVTLFYWAVWKHIFLSYINST